MHDGKVHEYLANATTMRVAKDARTTFGIGPTEVWTRAMREAVDVDLLAVLLYAARRQGGEPHTRRIVDEIEGLTVDMFNMEILEDAAETTEAEEQPDPE